MAATRQDIERWFDRGLNSEDRYMLIVCDTYDHEDYPVYCLNESDARKRMESPGNMQRVMECYDLRADKKRQLSMNRCWALK